MSLSLYELLFCFFLYSFGGWALEVCYYSWRKRRFINPGFLNGPFCPIYGIALVWMLVGFEELKGQYVFEFLAFAIVGSFLQFTAGHILEKIFGRRWWDYSGHRYNIDGLISPRMAVFWGAGSIVVLKFVQPLVRLAVHLIPGFLGRLILILLTVIFTADIIGTSAAVRYWNKDVERSKTSDRLEEFTRGLRAMSRRIGLWIYTRVRKRLERAEAAKLAEEAAARLGESVEKSDGTEAAGAEKKVFAKGCCFYKLVWLFFIGAFLGDITETIFCHATTGIWMSRSSVVYGPFSIVWGMGVVLLTATLYRFYDREDRYIFMAGTFLGGVYEYLCSVFTELVFGTVFWDYSKIPFNLGGRINLLYCFFWGIAALVWLKLFYPRFSAWIEKIPVKPGKIISWVLILFMAVNMVISSMALIRYVERNTAADASVGMSVDAAVPAEEWENGDLSQWLDQKFPDQRMERIYPNVIIK